MTKARRHHTYDRVHIVVEAHFPPDDFRIRTVIAAPEAVADDDRFQKSRSGILLRVDAAKFGFRTQQREVVGTRDQAFCPNRSISAADRRTARRHRRDFPEYARAVLQIPKLRHRHSDILFTGAAKIVEDTHELFWMRERQRLEQDTIHHAEGGDIGSDAKRKRKHRDRRKTAALEQRSDRVTQVFEE
jgi:hypothetical protein